MPRRKNGPDVTGLSGLKETEKKPVFPRQVGSVKSRMPTAMKQARGAKK